MECIERRREEKKEEEERISKCEHISKWKKVHGGRFSYSVVLFSVFSVTITPTMTVKYELIIHRDFQIYSSFRICTHSNKSVLYKSIDEYLCMPMFTDKWMFSINLFQRKSIVFSRQ